jgi:outer membrane scaffolding protein for murein synthesis (MipA/OmpV family)
MSIQCRWLNGLVFTVVLLLQSARAEEEKPLWELGLGAAALRILDYRGSDQSYNYVLPYPYVIYRGGILRIDKETVSGRLFKTDRLFLDISLFGTLPVDSSENDARKGMPDLDATFQIGPALNIRLLGNEPEDYHLVLSLPARAAFAADFWSVRSEGWAFSPKLKLDKADFIPGSGLNLWASAGPLFATQPYHEYYYSVAPAFATAARPAYSAPGGYGGSALAVGLNKQYKRFIFGTFVNADFLQGAAFENSPLVKSKSSVFYGVSVTYVFYKSKRMTTTDP